ncbi:hypothetical protein PQX77_009250 [Marasmius sp. AFHP31]|nr:hypothetical protein PQX77_009250 [Marasmius sp. AFHP31]
MSYQPFENAPSTSSWRDHNVNNGLGNFTVNNNNIVQQTTARRIKWHIQGSEEEEAEYEEYGEYRRSDIQLLKMIHHEERTFNREKGAGFTDRILSRFRRINGNSDTTEITKALREQPAKSQTRNRTGSMTMTNDNNTMVNGGEKAFRSEQANDASDPDALVDCQTVREAEEMDSGACAGFGGTYEGRGKMAGR